MIFVDTGAFIAKFLQKDQHHAEALPIWERIEREKKWLCTSNFIIDELATYLARHANQAFAARKIRTFYNSAVIKILRPSEQDERLAVKFFERYTDQDVSFTDCVSFALMRSHRIAHAFAFDRHFDLPGFLRIPLIS